MGRGGLTNPVYTYKISCPTRFGQWEGGSIDPMGPIMDPMGPIMDPMGPIGRCVLGTDLGGWSNFSEFQTFQSETCRILWCVSTPLFWVKFPCFVGTCFFCNQIFNQ